MHMLQPQQQLHKPVQQDRLLQQRPHTLLESCTEVACMPRAFPLALQLTLLLISLCLFQEALSPRGKGTGQSIGIVHTAQHARTFRAVVHYNDQLAQAGESLLAAHNIRVVQGLQNLQPHERHAEELACHEVCIAQQLACHMHMKGTLASCSAASRSFFCILEMSISFSTYFLPSLFEVARNAAPKLPLPSSWAFT